MMTVTELSLKGHFCPSCTPNRAKPLFGRKNRMVQPDSLNVSCEARVEDSVAELSLYEATCPVLHCYGRLPHAEIMGGCARSSRPAVTFARWRSMSSAVAIP